jgi:hypothetical protein
MAGLGRSSSAALLTTARLHRNVTTVLRRDAGVPAHHEARISLIAVDAPLNFKLEFPNSA